MFRDHTDVFMMVETFTLKYFKCLSYVVSQLRGKSTYYMGDWSKMILIKCQNL